MTRWFRLYDETLNDPKILKLPDSLFRIWIGLLCVASKNDGRLPSIDDTAIMLRSTPLKIAAAVDKLVESGLIDMSDDGLSPHNWNSRQYKSDVSTERVKRFRNGQRNVTVTPPETEQIQITDTEQRKKEIRAVAKTTRPNADFDLFWETRPRRKGADPKEPARKVYEAAVKAGAVPAELLASLKRYALLDADHVGTPYLPQMVKWLRDKRWSDYPQIQNVVAFDGLVEVLDQLQLEAWDAYGVLQTGKPYPRNKKGGWRFPSKWPPGYENKMFEGVEKLVAVQP